MSNKGFSITEVIVAIGIFIIMVSSFSGGLIFINKSTVISADQLKALSLADEGMVAINAIRSADYNNLNDGTYGLNKSAGYWQLSPTSDTFDKFTRTIDISTIGENEKKVETKISWNNKAITRNISLFEHFFNWKTISETIKDWANVFIPHSLNIGGNSNALKVIAKGEYAYIIKSNDDDLQIIDINPVSSSTVISSLSLPGTSKDIALTENYAYIASNNNSNELQIIDINNPHSPSAVDSRDLKGKGDALSIETNNLLMFLGRSQSKEEEFYVFDISQADNPIITSSIDLDDDVNDIYISGNYAYLALSRSAEELQVIDISDPYNISIAGNYDLANASDSLSITGTSTSLFIGRASGEIYIFDISNPTNPLNTYIINDRVSNINDLEIKYPYLFTASDDNLMEFSIYNISNINNVSMTSSLDMNNNINGLAYLNDVEMLITVGDNNNQEISIISPQ